MTLRPVLPVIAALSYIFSRGQLLMVVGVGVVVLGLLETRIFRVALDCLPFLLYCIGNPGVLLDTDSARRILSAVPVAFCYCRHAFTAATLVS